MVAAAVGSLFRRGLELGASHLQKDPEQTYKLPTWAAILMGLTVLFFVLVSAMVSSSEANPETPQPLTSYIRLNTPLVD